MANSGRSGAQAANAHCPGAGHVPDQHSRISPPLRASQFRYHLHTRQSPSSRLFRLVRVARCGFRYPHDVIVVLHGVPDSSSSGELVLPLFKDLTIDSRSSEVTLERTLPVSIVDLPRIIHQPVVQRCNAPRLLPA